VYAVSRSASATFHLSWRIVAIKEQNTENMMNLADIKAEKPKRTREKKFYLKTLSHKPLI